MIQVQVIFQAWAITQQINSCQPNRPFFIDFTFLKRNMWNDCFDILYFWDFTRFHEISRDFTRFNEIFIFVFQAQAIVRLLVNICQIGLSVMGPLELSGQWLILAIQNVWPWKNSQMYFKAWSVPSESFENSRWWDSLDMKMFCRV